LTTQSGTISGIEHIGRVGTTRIAAKEYSDEQKEATHMHALLKRISVKPEVCFGKPCIRGTRIWVSLILDLLADGMSIEQVLEEYPTLTREDILASIAYGAEMSREHYVELPHDASEEAA